MIFKLFGVKIRITFLFTAILCFMLFIDRTGLILPLFLAVFAHEAAHIFAMRILKCAPHEIELIPGSIRIINPQKYSIKKENIILLSGPACNMILFAVFYIIFLLSGSIFLLNSAAVQLIIGAFNLLPAKGLDGGQLVYNLFAKRLPVATAILVYTVLSALVGSAFLAYGLVSIIRGEVNLSVFILGIYIIILSFTNKC